MDELIMAGVELMGVGMGVVFLFLGLMVAIVALVSAVVQKGETMRLKSAPDDQELLFVFNEAIKRYRADHPK